MRERRLRLIIADELEARRSQRVENVERVELELALVLESRGNRVLQHTLVQQVGEPPRVFGLVVVAHVAIVAPTVRVRV